MSGWNGSARRDELPRDWPRIRNRILKRDPVCACDGCKHHDLLCHSPSTDVDHIADRHDHSDSNLRGLCRDCHGQHTVAQAVAARGFGPLRLRKVEQHPGATRGPVAGIGEGTP